MSAGSITPTYSNGVSSNYSFANVNRIVLAWTSDGSGNVSGIPTDIIAGTLCKVEFVPGTGGSTPTDNYDVTLTDSAGVDVLGGQGANRDDTLPSAVVPGVAFTDGTTISVAPCIVCDPLTLNITGAGATKTGQVILYVR